jgi:hypothetical protein
MERRENPWVAHVKLFAERNGISYSCALTDPRCKSTYKSGASVEPPPPKMTAKQLARKIKNIELTAKVRRDKELQQLKSMK